MDKEIKSFTEKIGAIEPRPGEEIYLRFKTLFKRSNYFFFKGYILIVKISRSDKPFWGVGRKYIKLLNTFDNYFLVLLVSENEGWFFSKKEINKSISDGVWNLRIKDDNYKINYNTIRYSKNHFTTPEQFLNKVGLLLG